MAIRIQVSTGDGLPQQFEHTSGSLEFGSGVQRDARRCRLDDATVSEDHLRIEERDGRLLAENLSEQQSINLSDGVSIPVGQSRELGLPVELLIGQTTIRFEPVEWSPPFRPHVRKESPETSAFVAVTPANHQPSPDRLSEWLHTIIELEHMPAGSSEFYTHVARTLVNLIGMDLGLVLLRQNEDWVIAGSVTTGPHVPARFSRTLVNFVTTRRQTFFEDLNQLPEAASLENLQAGVAAPIFGLHDEVVGVLYGSRGEGLSARGAIGPMEAQLVQLLSGAAGANLARATALRTRVQFEQFFSPELVRELERDPNLLEGRTEEVTLLFSDLRGFTTLSQRLGAQKTCRLIRDMMEVLSEQIVSLNGVIVDYVGDGIMAMWNAPAQQSDHAARACTAALAMLGELPGLNQRWGAEIGEPLELGIGINTGMAQVGNLGSTRKFKYGPNGHTVNLACRVQDATKSLGTPLLITESTFRKLPKALQSRRLGRIQLIDVLAPMTLYELRGQIQDGEWTARQTAYERSLELFEQQKWLESCTLLRPLVQSDLKDLLAAKLLHRAEECRQNPPAAFDSVVVVIGSKSSAVPSGMLPRLSNQS